ncbi:glycerophosphodiester phosphodiesterase [Maribacter polysiphoniae]|uniref:Glycerophosphodiester phosphodiesterase n=1 Tax=Maribacter polysiphoniae TaxID=429344 RepID=A0A316E989_9FLAO|nr:glycerophosphodiester phosphodiesterase family protein [Maribacter polysiphoniae]MBD1260474.1 glycerophosphodiester phosphodiesterase [Maribacter polysiphoniae]PWK25939.1 glycerophosphoryl diester phosphodiesterase [Maribacter polysiphoniae]
MKKPIVYFLLLSLLLTQSCKMNDEPLVIGHRGAMGHETENTVASIQKALELGVDMIEIDVFKIKSGEIVVFHDDTVDRLANATGKIEEFDISQIKQMVLEGNQTIPLLKDVIDVLDDDVRLNIELKGAGTADKVNSIVNEFLEKKDWDLDKFIISSFNWEELKSMRRVNKDIPIAILTGDDIEGSIALAKELNAEAVNPSFKGLDMDSAKKIKEAGFKIYTWTVNKPEDIDLVKSFDVDGIITNYPERIN